MKKEIKIDGTRYLLDITQAKKQGLLIERGSYPLKAGDVYVDPDKASDPFLLVCALWDSSAETARVWCLLGLANGTAPNSDPFHRELHTLDEISDYLAALGMIYSHTIRYGNIWKVWE